MTSQSTIKILLAKLELKAFSAARATLLKKQ